MNPFPSESGGDDRNTDDFWHNERSIVLREAQRIAGEIEKVRTALVGLRIPEWLSDFPYMDKREEADRLERQLVELADGLCFEIASVFDPLIKGSALRMAFLRTLIRIDNVVEGPATSSRMAMILNRETLPPDRLAA